MPAGPAPRPITRRPVARRFEGVMLLVDPAFIGPGFLQLAQNWRPSQAFRLRKRQGTVLWQTEALAQRVQHMWAEIHPSSGARLFYQVRSNGDMRFRVDDSVTTITNGTFATSGLFPYGMAALGGFLYVGNGTDPIKQIPITNAATTAVDLTALGSFTDTSVAPSAAADSASSMLVGSYSFCWGVYNSVTKRWITRGQARSIRLNGPAGSQHLTFTSPAGGDYTLQANELFHLFVAPVNLPIEFGSDQTIEGVAQATAGTIVRDLVVDGPPTPRRGTTRTGNILRAHRSSLWIAGAAADPRAIYTTYPLVFGREQAQYDLAAFFPALARYEMPFEITAMAPITTTGRFQNDQPRAPMAVFAYDRLQLLYGDLIGDPSFEPVEVNSRGGCTSPMSLAPTDHGLFYLGTRSVYVIPPGGGAPIDVGWPIEPAIAAIPQTARKLAVGLYHKGFYTLYFAPAGGSTNTFRWDLDLRQGIGSVPSWWGPMLGIGGVTAAVVEHRNPNEDDRGYAALERDAANFTVNIVHLDQEGDVTDAAVTANGSDTTIVAVGVTHEDDDQQPFIRKLYTGFRIKARSEEETSLSVNFMVDGGDPVPFSNINLPGTLGDEWDLADWNLDDWAATASLVEGDAEAPEERDARGMSAAVMFTHSEACNVELRDYEMAYVPSGREKAEDPNIP